MPKRPERTDEEIEFQRTLGQRIAAARTHAGLSQRQLCARLGYSYGWLQKIESGENGIVTTDLLRLSEAIPAPLDYLLGYDTTFTPHTRGDFRLMFQDNLVADTLHTVADALHRARRTPIPI
jgi:transcriptional regulator with XRE-family HTH domain